MTPFERLTHPLALLAAKIAAEARPEQSGTSSMPRPRRLARLVATLDSTTEVDVAAAFLHDVLEDSRLTATALSDRLLAGGADPVAAAEVVGLVQELTRPYRSDSGFRPVEKRLKDYEKLRVISDRAKRIKLCDCLDTLLNGQRMTPDILSAYLAESRRVVDAAGEVDPPLAGWLLCEIDAVARKVKQP